MNSGTDTVVDNGSRAALTKDRERLLALSSGRRVEVVEGEAFDTLFIHARGGQCVLAIRVTDEGPILSFQAAALDIACDELAIRTKRSASITAGGGIDLRANDDVTIAGERVRLNSDDPPMPISWEESLARRAAREDRAHDLAEATRIEPFVWVGPSAD